MAKSSTDVERNRRRIYAKLRIKMIGEEMKAIRAALQQWREIKQKQPTPDLRHRHLFQKERMTRLKKERQDLRGELASLKA